MIIFCLEIVCISDEMQARLEKSKISILDEGE